MSQPYPADANHCARSDAQNMRLRLARRRLQEVRATDPVESDPAALIASVRRLANTVDDLIRLIDEGCPGHG